MELLAAEKSTQRASRTATGFAVEVRIDPAPAETAKRITKDRPVVISGMIPECEAIETDDRSGAANDTT